MRNMEVYMGEDNGAWENGLYKESTKQKNQIKNLRTKYVSKILTSQLNEMKSKILDKVLAFMSMKASAHMHKRRNETGSLYKPVKLSVLLNSECFFNRIIVCKIHPTYFGYG